MTQYITQAGTNQPHEHNKADAVTQERQHRKRSLKGGVITYGNGAISVDCVVRDLAEGGAKIKLVNDLMVPNDFQLQIPSDGISVACVVRWRTAQEMGVEFKSPLVFKENLKRQVISTAGLERSTPSILRRL